MPALPMKPRDVLLLAETGHKGMGWKITPNGRVINREGRYFEVSNPSDLGNVQIALSRRGWQFLQTTKNGEQWFKLFITERPSVKPEPCSNSW